jgi:GT2 family glycosyltransferase
MCESDILVYTHSDVTIHDPEWLLNVLLVIGYFPNVVAVGLGGALSLGNKDLYRKPYNIRNMARGHYMSNQTDAQIHGERFTGVHRVAVLDAFFMAIRTDWLRSIGGWPTKHLTHHCLDLWLACEAARHNKGIWMTGVSCTHHGGGTSVKPIYKDAKWLQAGSLESDHILPHLWLYNEYRDVLPIEV